MGKEEGGPDAFSSPSHTCRFFFCWAFLGDEQVTDHTCGSYPEGELKPFIDRYRDRGHSIFLGQGRCIFSPWENVGLSSWKPKPSAHHP